MIVGFSIDGEALFRREWGVVVVCLVEFWGFHCDERERGGGRVCVRNRSGMCVFLVCGKIRGRESERRGVRLWGVREARGGVYLRFKGGQGEGT